MSTPITDNSVGTEVCHWCCSHPGWVIAFEQEHEGAMYEQMAPCPNCEKGRALEFGKVGYAQWGRDGFWRGRPTNLRKDCRCNEPRKGDQREARQWLEMLVANTKDVEPVASGREQAAAVLDGGLLGESGVPEAAQSAAPARDSTPEPASGGGPEVTTGSPGAAEHDCPHFKKVVPWSQEECAMCNPATPEETL